mgnify:CR=1 FL=1
MKKLEHELHMVNAGKGPGDALALVLRELVELRERVAKLEARPQYAPQASTRGDTVIGPRQDYSIWHNRMSSRGSK